MRASAASGRDDNNVRVLVFVVTGFFLVPRYSDVRAMQHAMRVRAVQRRASMRVPPAPLFDQRGNIEWREERVCYRVPLPLLSPHTVVIIRFGCFSFPRFACFCAN